MGIFHSKPFGSTDHSHGHPMDTSIGAFRCGARATATAPTRWIPAGIPSRPCPKKRAMSEKVRMIQNPGFFCGLILLCVANLLYRIQVLHVIICSYMFLYDLISSYMILYVIWTIQMTHSNPNRSTGSRATRREVMASSESNLTSICESNVIW